MLVALLIFHIFPFQIIGTDLIINSICISLSFDELNREYGILCKSCKNCDSICCPNQKAIHHISNNNNSMVENNIAQKQKSIIEGEDTLNNSEITITKTQNEGKQHLQELEMSCKIGENTTNNHQRMIIEEKENSQKNEYITNGFELNNNQRNGENSQYSFTSKIQDKNDELIAKELADNEIHKNYITKGAIIYQTNK